MVDDFQDWKDFLDKFEKPLIRKMTLEEVMEIYGDLLTKEEIEKIKLHHGK